MKPIPPEVWDTLTPVQKNMLKAWIEVDEKAGNLKDVHPRILDRSIAEAYARNREQRQEAND